MISNKKDQKKKEIYFGLLNVREFFRDFTYCDEILSGINGKGCIFSLEFYACSVK
jgi:hypothetical protein